MDPGLDGVGLKVFPAGEGREYEPVARGEGCLGVGLSPPADEVLLGAVDLEALEWLPCEQGSGRVAPGRCLGEATSSFFEALLEQTGEMPAPVS